MIHICYAMNDTSGRYCKFVGTSMLSLLDNTLEDITVHIITDNTMSASSHKKLVEIAQKYNQQIRFYNVDELATYWIKKICEIPIFNNYMDRYLFGIGAMYRLLIPTLLPDEVEKTIYLDADTIVTMDIKQLWEFDIQGAPIAGVSEYLAGAGAVPKYQAVKRGYCTAKGYVNSGVLVMDLKQFRDESKYGRTYMISECIKFLMENEAYMMDQVSLAHVFANEYFYLPYRFNNLVALMKSCKRKLDNNSIIHYCGDYALHLYMPGELNRVFFEYFLQTPFFNPDTFENFYDECLRVFNESLDSVNNKFDPLFEVMRLSMQKSRVFFATGDNLSDIKNQFLPSESDIAIDSSMEDSETRLLDLMKTRDQNRIFFIYTDKENHPDLKDKLVEEGFVENKDFFDSKTIFSAGRVSLPHGAMLLRKM